MTPESPLDALRRLDREATPGPWTQASRRVHSSQYEEGSGEPVMLIDKMSWVRDAELIVTLRNTLPALLRLVDAVQDWEVSMEALVLQEALQDALAELTCTAVQLSHP